MVLAFNSMGDFAKAVYGDSSAQHAGTNGSIATTNPSMTGGRRRRQRQSQRQSQRQRAGQSQRRQSQRRQRQSQRRRRQSQRQQQQRGGK